MLPKLSSIFLEARSRAFKSEIQKRWVLLIGHWVP
ncbi:uncharacterized protein G2W53_018833 [Senna tora]|uniref:Uncharacterized protein n=1 Tax=Senna tora TaxID=362788 RepID=A0A834U175_9FABA|nr:uncharacterized protein G2W53_018833 [Senna tora]